MPSPNVGKKLGTVSVLRRPMDCMQLCFRYGEAHRAYHTLQHLKECFEHFDGARQLAVHPFEVALALWFHDAIYDPRATDCEAQSAAWAAECLLHAGAVSEQIERVSGLILATKHASSEGSIDCGFLLDTDLSILSASRPRFVEYEAQVRCEYSWVPEKAFHKTRGAILARFLQRPRIYTTDHFSNLFESHARSNLRYSLERLGV